MEIRHLRSFVAVAEERSFTRAAARLHLATSPLSRRIRELERELGRALFVRNHHRVDLTAAGQALLPLVRDVLERADALPDACAAAAAAPRRARIGIASDVPSVVRDALLAALPPDLAVRLHPASTAALLRLLAADELELALVHGPVRAAGLQHRMLRTDPVGVVVAAGAGFDDRRSVRLDELAHLPFASVDWAAAPSIYRGVDRTLRAAGVTGRRIVEGDNFAGLAHLVACGEAFAFVGGAGGAMTKAFSGEPVVHLRVEGLDLRITTEAVWRGGPSGVAAGPGDVVAELVAALDRLPAPPDRGAGRA